MNSHIRRILAASAVAAVTATAGDAVRAQARHTPERFTALAATMGRLGDAQSGILEMTVTDWFTDDDLERLIATLIDEGSGALLDELRDIRPVGYLRMPDGMQYDLLFARDLLDEHGGRRVILLTDFVSLSQPADEPDSFDQGFALIDLRLDPKGGGVGAMSLAIRIAEHEERGLITHELYAVQTVSLTGVRGTKLPTS